MPAGPDPPAAAGRRPVRAKGQRAVHIVVMGCGRVGSSLAHRLEQAGHSVAIIDQNPLAFRRLGPDFAGSQVSGTGFDQQTLRQAGIERAAAFAAVSSGDNSNIIAARVARETFNVDHVVARIYDPKRAAVYERLGIPTIATVPWTTEEMLRALIGYEHTEHWRDPTGRVVLAQLDVHENWVGHRASDLEASMGARIVYLTRFGEARLPDPGTVVQQGDLITVAMTDEIASGVRAVAAAPPEGNH
jgi:trk/ktr system potassium uptake protein